MAPAGQTVEALPATAADVQRGSREQAWEEESSYTTTAQKKHEKTNQL